MDYGLATINTNMTFYDSDHIDSQYLNFSSICFPPFTKVQTDKGLTEIGDLKRGDLVKLEED